MLKMGFIGNGKSTNRYHLPFVLKSGKFEVKTIYQRNLNKFLWTKNLGTTYTDDLSVLLTDQEIEVVAICTPHQFHFEYAKQVLAANKHCIVEKPFTTTKAEAEELFALAASKGLMLQAYQNRRFDSDFLTTQKVIEGGKLGDLLELEMHYDYFRPEVPESVTEFDSNSSYLYGHACHTLDQVVSYFGKPDSIHYDVKQLLGSGRMNDYFDLDLYYGGLKVSVKSSYFRIKERPSFIVYGKEGMFVKADKDRQEEHLKMFYMPTQPDFGLDEFKHYGTLTHIQDGIIQEESVPTVYKGYEEYYRRVYETIVNGAAVCVKPEETLLVMEMLETGVSQLH